MVAQALEAIVQQRVDVVGVRAGVDEILAVLVAGLDEDGRDGLSGLGIGSEPCGAPAEDIF